MDSGQNRFENIDQYLAMFSGEKLEKMEELRQIIKKAAPQATETISYGMPAFKQNKILVYFAAAKEHLGFYPTGAGIEQFKKELTGFEFSKGTIKFPWDKPLPRDLIKKIVEFRVSENLTK